MNYTETTTEFMRYALVGGTAFLVDTGTLFLTQRYMFHNLGNNGVLIATACGFIVGLIYNYLLSVRFVFNQGIETVRGKTLKTFAIFVIIGIIGLGFTEFGMWFGLKFIKLDYYLFIKSIVAILVLVWNYAARKLIIFN